MIANALGLDGSAAEGLVITHRWLSDSVEIVAVAGELDMATTPAFREALDRVHPGVRSLVLDLSGLVFIDSHGVHALFQQAAVDHLVVVVPQASIVRRVLDLNNAAQVLTLSETLDEALQKNGGPSGVVHPRAPL